MKQNISYTISGNGTIHAVIKGVTYSAPQNYPTYTLMRKALNRQDGAGFIDCFNMGKQLPKASGGELTLKMGQYLFRGQPINNALTKRMTALIAQGFDVKPMVNFLTNCLQNLRPEAIEELWLFMDANALPITPDGYLLAYRRVGPAPDYYSLHANPDGTYNKNRIGDTPKMNAADVDPDRNNTCSRGLHFCSLSYLPSYGAGSNGNATMIVKIHPKDIRAIPSDYSNQKGRCSRYEVVDEHTLGDTVDGMSESAVYEVLPQKGIRPRILNFLHKIFN